MFTKSFLTGALLGALAVPLTAQVTLVSTVYVGDFDGSAPPSNPLRDETGVALFAGTDAVGDGDIIQIGYFNGILSSSDVSLFGQSEWDAFTPITSVGGRYLTTIGDMGGISGNMGIFSISDLLFDSGDSELPGHGFALRLGIRFYNSTGMDAATHFNTVTCQDAAWTLVAPNNPPPLPAYLSLDGGSYFWQSGPGGEFQTIIAIPEPSPLSLLLLGALSFSLQRRRRRWER